MRADTSNNSEVAVRLTSRLQRIRGLVQDGERLCAVAFIRSSTGRDFTWKDGPHFLNWPVITTPRAVGSTIKVALYSAFLETFPKSIDEIFNDEPFSITLGGKVCSVRNNDGQYRGSVNLKTAFAQSLNVIAMQLIQRLGVYAFSSYLRACGVTQPIPNSPFLALGTIELTGAELLSTLRPIAYSSIPLSPPIASVMKKLLAATAKDGTAAYLQRHLGELFGGKTGTSEGSKDLWFIGQISRTEVGLVWLGRKDRREIRSLDGIPASAARFAVPLWFDLLEAWKKNPAQ